MCSGKIVKPWLLMVMAMPLISAVGCAGSCGCLRSGISGRLARPVVFEETIVDNDLTQSETMSLAVSDEPKIVSVLFAARSSIEQQSHKIGQGIADRRLQLGERIEARGRQNGCGEFFWNSWHNDPPALADYATAVE
jgi:hypothetical protein